AVFRDPASKFREWLPCLAKYHATHCTGRDVVVNARICRKVVHRCGGVCLESSGRPHPHRSRAREPPREARRKEAGRQDGSQASGQEGCCQASRQEAGREEAGRQEGSTKEGCAEEE